MPFALIPDGYKLQKVSKLQKEAVDKFYSSKNVDSFLEGQASGELVKAVAIVVTPIVLAALTKQAGERAVGKVEDVIPLLLRLNPVTLPADVALATIRQLGFITEEEEAKIRADLPIL